MLSVDNIVIHINSSKTPCPNTSINDYKFFCFNGRVEFMKVDFDRQTDHHANYYNRNFEFLEFGEVLYMPVKEKAIHRPENFDKMIELAEKLSKGHRFLRVDFYEVNHMVYFGETTFYPSSGAVAFVPDSADIEIGKLLRLNN